MNFKLHSIILHFQFLIEGALCIFLATIFLLSSNYIVSAESVTSVTSNTWTLAATWSNNSAPSAQNDYFITSGFTVNAPTVTAAGTFSYTFAGGSLTVETGGILNLPSTSTSNNATVSYSIPNLLLEDGSSLRLHSGTGNVNRTLTTGLTVASSGSVTIFNTTTTNSYNSTLILGPNAPLTGGADIHVDLNVSGQPNLFRKYVRINSANNAYTGDWYITSTSVNVGQKQGALMAGAVNALGTGMVYLDQSYLVNAVNDGLDSLRGVVAGSNSVIRLDGDWFNPAASLDLVSASSRLDFNASNLTASIGNLNGVAGSQIRGSAGGSQLGLTITSASEFQGVISGDLALTKAGPETLILTGSNTYTAGTIIADGTLQLGDGGTSGSIVGDVENDGILVFNRSDIIEFSGLISGSGELVQMGSGTTILTADNSYSGLTTIAAGILQLGNGGTSGSIVGDVINDGQLIFNRSNLLLLPGSISGSGSVIQIGSGTTVLTGDSDYSGGTTISAGALQLGNGGSSGSVIGDIVNNSQLVFDRSNQLVVPGTITGSGSVSQIGSGTTILTADNSYSGGTIITVGILQLGDGGTTGSIVGNVVDNGELAFDRSDVVTFSGLISGSGSLAQIGTGTTILTANNSYGGGTTISAGILQLGNGGTSGSIIGNVVNNGELAFNRSDVVIFSGLISGSGGLAQIGSGTTILTADNSYGGVTTISAGTLQLGNGGTTGNIVGDIVNDSRLIFNRANQLIVAGNISGSGSVSQIGTGTTILTGDSDYGGGTTISTGALQLGNGGTTGSITGDIVNDSQLVFDRSNLLSLAGIISGSGSVSQTGTGTTLLLAQNTYRGDTLVTAGTLQAGTANAFSRQSSFSIAAGATLDLDSHAQTVASLVNSGTASFGVTGSPGTILNVSNDYSGNAGTLIFKTALGDDASPTDLLVVHGSTAGQTAVKVVNVGGLGAITNNGIEIIRVDGASNGNFTLIGDFIAEDGEPAVVGGAFAYTLQKNGITTPGDGNWYLRASLADPQYPITPEDPLYQPGVPMYESYPEALQVLNGLPTLRQRTGNRLWSGKGNRMLAEGADPVTATPYASAPEAGTAINSNGVWGRIDAAHHEIEPRISNSYTDYQSDMLRFQSGMDGQFADNSAGALIGGVSVHFVHGETHVNSPYGDGNVSTDGYGFSGTLTWYGNDGFYIDGQAQATWYISDLLSAVTSHSLIAGNRAIGYGISAELGKRIALGDQWSVVPQAQLIYSNVDFNTFRDVFNAPVRLDKGDSLQARGGLALDYQTAWRSSEGFANRANAYAIANLYYEFLDGNEVDVGGTKFFSAQQRLWGGIGLGGSFNWHDDRYAIFGEGLINTSLEKFGDSHALQGNLGFRMHW